MDYVPLSAIIVSCRDGFDIIGYATAVGNELLWALESLVERKYTKGT